MRAASSEGNDVLESGLERGANKPSGVILLSDVTAKKTGGADNAGGPSVGETWRQGKKTVQGQKGEDKRWARAEARLRDDAGTGKISR